MYFYLCLFQILDNIDIVFKQLERDGASAGSDAQQFLVDLQENMPRLSHKRNLQCCPVRVPQYVLEYR